MTNNEVFTFDRGKVEREEILPTDKYSLVITKARSFEIEKDEQKSTLGSVQFKVTKEGDQFDKLTSTVFTLTGEMNTIADQFLEALGYEKDAKVDWDKTLVGQDIDAEVAEKKIISKKTGLPEIRNTFKFHRHGTLDLNPVIPTLD